MSKKVKIARDLPPLKKITKEETQALLEEGRKLVKEMCNPPPPGDYKLGWRRRGKKTEHTCSSCKGAIEVIYHMVMPEPIVFGPGGKGHWAVKNYRCSNCKLEYDFS